MGPGGSTVPALRTGISAEISKFGEDSIFKDNMYSAPFLTF